MKLAYEISRSSELYQMFLYYFKMHEDTGTARYSPTACKKLRIAVTPPPVTAACLWANYWLF